MSSHLFDLSPHNLTAMRSIIEIAMHDDRDRDLLLGTFDALTAEFVDVKAKLSRLKNLANQSAAGGDVAYGDIMDIIEGS